MTDPFSNAPDGSKLRLTFGYDYQGRRITKQVETWTGSTWVVTLSLKFIYDGWNLIAELNGTNNTLIRGYMWGTDLSGTTQGAGGVGGVIAVNDAVQGVHFAAFDGNGNVAALVKAIDGTVSASYEHGPFGELMKSAGLIATSNPIRFSTKYQDDDTGLLYYGYRYYNPSTGRWPNRDPIGEWGGVNLYGMVENNPISLIDYWGLWTTPAHEQIIDDWLRSRFPQEVYCGCCTIDLRQLLKNASARGDGFSGVRGFHWFPAHEPARWCFSRC